MDWQPIAPATIAAAKSFILRFWFVVNTQLGTWQSPHVASDGTGEVTFEWWHNTYSLTFFVGPGQAISYLTAWGLHMWDEMDEGDNPTSQNLVEIWSGYRMESSAAPMAVPSHVSDDEDLYRRVLPDPLFYERRPDGQIRVTRSAFNDPRMRPSVDRPRYCGYDPAHTQRGDPRCLGGASGATSADSRCGVVSLVAQPTVISGLSSGADGGQVIHAVDVEAVPLPDNAAHAEIVTSPQIDKDKAFRRLRTVLAELAKWEVLPEEFRN